MPSACCNPVLNWLRVPGCSGKEFDPNYHEAIGHAEDTDYPPHTVAEEVQRGYLMHERVLRLGSQARAVMRVLSVVTGAS